MVLLVRPSDPHRILGTLVPRGGHYNKPIGIVSNSGGITAILKEIAEICDKNGEKENIVCSSNPKELVSMILNKLK